MFLKLNGFYSDSKFGLFNVEPDIIYNFENNLEQ